MIRRIVNRKKTQTIIFLGLVAALFYLFVSLYFKVSPSNFHLFINPKKVTPLNPIYYVKVGRENIQSFFFFGDEDIAYFNFTIAEKRLNEARILSESGIKSLTKNQALLAKSANSKGYAHLEKLIDRIDTNFLMEKYKQNDLQIKQYLSDK